VKGFVLDCSVTMSWCFEDEVDSYSESVMDKLEGCEAVVPWIWTLEVANALISAERRARMTAADTSRFLRVLAGIAVLVDATPPAKTMDELVALGRCHGLSAYDAAYLELAMREGLPIATLDGELRAAAAKAGVSIFEG
jgi:predicted nucleic acid-binding protein